MITPIIVLVISIFLIYLFICRILTVWMNMTTYWNRVAYRQRAGERFSIEYSFTVSTATIVALICGIAGMLWSIIKLAMIA